MAYRVSKCQTIALLTYLFITRGSCGSKNDDVQYVHQVILQLQTNWTWACLQIVHVSIDITKTHDTVNVIADITSQTV